MTGSGQLRILGLSQLLLAGLSMEVSTQISQNQISQIQSNPAIAAVTARSYKTYTSNSTQAFFDRSVIDKQPENVKTSLSQVTQRLSEQLKNTSDNNLQFDLSNMMIENIWFEDTNQDGLLNAGDNLIISIIDEFGAKDEVKITLTEDSVSIFRNENSADSLIKQAIIKLFIEQMKLQIILSGQQLREFIGKSSPDFSL
jgi:hypothetical protein